MTVTVYVAIYFQTLFFIALSASVSPLLLLRSRRSQLLACLSFSRMRRVVVKSKFAQGSTFHETNFDLIYLPAILLLASLAIRVVSTIRYVHFGIRDLPMNWRRTAFASDSLSPIEFVPGSGPVMRALARGKRYAVDPTVRLSFALIATGGGLWICHAASKSYLTLVDVPGLLASALALSFITPYFYRWSLKSTTLLWLPLIYVVQETYTEKSASLRLVDLRDSAISKIRRVVSWLVLGGLAYKFAILPQVSTWWAAQPWTPVINVFLMPETLHLWHVATGLNAAVALGSYYLYFERAPRFIEDGAWSEATARRVMNALLWVHFVISTYTISAGLVLTWRAAFKLNVPPWSTELFP